MITSLNLMITPNVSLSKIYQCITICAIRSVNKNFDVLPCSENTTFASKEDITNIVSFLVLVLVLHCVIVLICM